MTSLLTSLHIPQLKIKKVQVDLSYKQAILIGLGLGLSVAALKVLALAGAVCFA